MTCSGGSPTVEACAALCDTCGLEALLKKEFKANLSGSRSSFWVSVLSESAELQDLNEVSIGDQKIFKPLSF